MSRFANLGLDEGDVTDVPEKDLPDDRAQVEEDQASSVISAEEVSYLLGGEAPAAAGPAAPAPAPAAAPEPAALREDVTPPIPPRKPSAAAQLHAEMAAEFDWATLDAEDLAVENPEKARDPELYSLLAKAASRAAEEKQAQVRDSRERHDDERLFEATGSEEDEHDIPSRGNMFDSLRGHSADMTRRRFATVRPRTLVIGGVLVAAALAAGAQTRTVREWSQGPLQTVHVQESNFQAVRDIARSAANFAESGGPAAEAGEDYRRGAALAGGIVLSKMFKNVTDPEARLAIVSVEVEHALRNDDADRLAEALHSLSVIPGADEDPRAHIVREKAFMRLVEISRRVSGPLATKWHRQAMLNRQAAQRSTENTVKGAGWNPVVAEQIRTSLIAAAGEPIIDQLGPSGSAGYMAALQHTGSIYNVASGMLYGETRSVQVARRR